MLSLLLLKLLLIAKFAKFAKKEVLSITPPPYNLL